MKKILITNRELNLIGGSETFTFTLAGKLFEKGLEVEVYSPILGYMASKLEEKGVTCKQELTGGEDYDVIHAHHFEPALYAKKLLPHVPMLFFSHGILPPPEYPPDHIMNDISMFGGVSLEIKNNLEKIGIEPRKIRVVYNGIDTDTFNASPLQEINPPYKILAITNHPEEDLLAMLDYLPPEKFNYVYTQIEKTYSERKGDLRIYDCHAGLTGCHIDPLGNVYACLTSIEDIGDDSYFMGNLREFNYQFDELWYSEKASRVREKVKKCVGCFSGCEIDREINCHNGGAYGPIKVEEKMMELLNKNLCSDYTLEEYKSCANYFLREEQLNEALQCINKAKELNQEDLEIKKLFAKFHTK